jgi:exodeoxyribonuclease V alpha subunit
VDFPTPRRVVEAAVGGAVGPDARSRFRRHRGNRLPHDVVIVDETLMVSLSLMARLVEAVRPGARLILVGDPGQLVSVEAGAVLGDIVGPAGDPGFEAGAGPAYLRDAVVVLRHVHRFGKSISRLARAVSAGDADAAVEALRDGGDEVTWLPPDVAEADADATQLVRELATRAAGAVHAAAADGDATGALRALEGFRLLCAHRRGPHGARDWMRTIERWLAADLPGFDGSREWYVGRPLLVTSNDYGLKLYNGDTGVVVRAGDDRIAAAFERAGGVVEFAPTRLGAVDTVYAMTIHKAQGSQFGTVAVIVPPATSPLLTRELLYTGLTRAGSGRGRRDRGRGAHRRRAAGGRASGLRERLWGVK